MRRFIDFWIKGQSLDQALSLLKVLKKLGFSGAVLELQEELIEKFDELKLRANELGISLYRKLIVKPEGRRDLLKTLRGNRGRFEVITVICENLETALVAARDSRVDSLIIPPRPRFRIDKGVASLIKNRVELPFKFFLEDKQAFLETALNVIKFLGKKVDLIISSGAEDEYDLRNPRELAALLQVLGYDQEKALDSVSKIPEQILEENMLKLSKQYVARGVIKLD